MVITDIFSCNSTVKVETTQPSSMEKSGADELSENLARDLLPDDREYHFEEVNIVSPVDEYGEVKMEIVARTDIYDKDGAKKFLADFNTSSGSTFNLKSGRADRSGEHCHLRGYRKCMMKVVQSNENNPRIKGLHQDCGAEPNFRVDKPRVMLCL